MSNDDVEYTKIKGDIEKMRHALADLANRLNLLTQGIYDSVEHSKGTDIVSPEHVAHGLHRITSALLDKE